MTDRNARLTQVSSEDRERLHAEADELAVMQDLLNKLPMGLQVESLTEAELERLRQITRSPVQMLCGDSLILWANLNRTHQTLAAQ